MPDEELLQPAYPFGLFGAFAPGYDFTAATYYSYTCYLIAVGVFCILRVPGMRIPGTSLEGYVRVITLTANASTAVSIALMIDTKQSLRTFMDRYSSTTVQCIQFNSVTI